MLLFVGFLVHAFAGILQRRVGQATLQLRIILGSLREVGTAS